LRISWAIRRVMVRVWPVPAAQLDRAGINYREVNIEHDSAAATFVADANGGNHTVPTVLLPDGAVLSNPTIDQITEATAA
jgi:mycoredoxin